MNIGTIGDQIKALSPSSRAFIKDAIDLLTVTETNSRVPVRLRLIGKHNDGTRIDLDQSFPAPKHKSA